MDSKGFSILSFKYAFEGLVAALRKEPNLKFHLIIAALVLLISFLLNISTKDWIAVVILIGFVIAVELTNTAIETVVDGLTQDQHPAAKIAKDISAGAVLIAAATAAIAGILIFAPYLIRWTI